MVDGSTPATGAIRSGSWFERDGGRSMAKKEKAKRTRTPKPRASKKAKSARQRHRKPASVALPGMEQTRDQRLDTLCKRIGDNTDALNELNREVDADKQAALDHMLANDVKQYHHHGVELIVRGGMAKLSVRPWKGDTVASSAPDAADEAAGE
jgi:hypothetical protein